ncbi:MAG: hypothetical protein AB7K09_09080 [Planctomycetota bacterium]
MDQPKGMSLDEFIHRKLQPVKILVGMLNREMDLNAGEDIHVSRMDFDNLITTLEIFIEDYERVSGVKGKRMQRAAGNSHTQFIDKPKAPVKAIA